MVWEEDSVDRRARAIALAQPVLIAVAAVPARAFTAPPGRDDGKAPAGGLGGLLFPLLVTFAIFYFLLIRPQQKQARERTAMLSAIKKGDNVVTSGGLHGKVTGITEKVVTLEVADVAGQKVRLKIDRDQIARVEKEPPA